MIDFPYRCALIIGAGPGISGSLDRFPYGWNRKRIPEISINRIHH